MTEPSPDDRFPEDPDNGTNPGRRPATPMPRWVKAFAITAVALVLIFVINHLTGGGMGNHAQ